MIMEVKRMGSKLLLGTAVVLMSFATSAVSQGPGGPMSAAELAEAALHKSVVAGDAWIVDKTTTLKSLSIEPGAAVAAPEGHSLTMTINGVETTLKPGKYEGNIVLTVTDQYAVKFSDTLIHHFRQALFLDASGIVPSKSVLAAAGDYKLDNGVLTGVDIKSVGENFNGILVTGGTYTLKGVKLDFEGNGGNDFAGYGAGIMSDGKNTTLILDDAKVATHGAVRTTVISNNGSNLIVKNSEISSKNGVLPADYIPNVTPGAMKSAPWMLGISGNVRATNILGDNSTSTYINSTMTADGWGVLSVDSSQNTKVTAINSKVILFGQHGYGTYCIGNSTNRFYGTMIKVPDYGAIITGGHTVFAASTPENLAALNTELKLQLTPAELASLKPEQTTVSARRFGIMMWGDATVKIADGTVFDGDEGIFLDKGATSEIDVDGSKGAQLNTKGGVIFQAMDNDDPGPQMVNGLMANTGVFHEPTAAPEKAKDFDLTAAHKTDMVAKFSDITLKGDFFNGIRSKMIGGGMGPDGPSKTPPTMSGMNLVLTFDKANVTGVITSSTTKHKKDTLTPDDFELIGEVTDTPSPAINNGVIVNLADTSTWTATGTSYLTSLTIGKGSTVKAPAGSRLTLTVDGKAKPVKAGTYKGAIVVTVTPAA